MKTELIEIEIDGLTNSIQNAISGDSFETDVLPVTDSDLLNVKPSKGWKFDWKHESKMPDRKIFKLTIKGNKHVIQGLMSIRTCLEISQTAKIGLFSAILRLFFSP